jgi:hypothetical protein
LPDKAGVQLSLEILTNMSVLSQRNATGTRRESLRQHEYQAQIILMPFLSLLIVIDGNKTFEQCSTGNAMPAGYKELLIIKGSS